MTNTDYRTIHSEHRHYDWDNSRPPVARVTSGTQLLIQCRDAADGHYGSSSTDADIASQDQSRINPVTGPIFIEGAEPGDTLKVTLESFTPSGFGWTAIIPGFGLLADQFPKPKLHLWNYENTDQPALFGEHAQVPLKPMIGTIGVAPAEPGAHAIIPPRRTGGNLDVRDLAAGVVLYLPVEIPGALLSLGDTHAAQGDGEVCGTAIESAMDVVVTLELEKDNASLSPRFSTPGPVTRHLDGAGYEVTTGVGPDLMAATRDAVSAMIDLLARWRGLAPDDAYMLCSVCADLRISEVVDAPNWVVSMYFPRVIFE